jgi:ABC-type dipeptide/oligopeptide/nickel transport system ATPase component
MSLQLEGVCVDIAGRRIVSDIDLHVEDGCFAGLLGPNGSGKSTILKAIYRVHEPSAGRVLLDGRDLPSLTARQAARRLAVVTQESTVEFTVTVWEMVMLGRVPHKRASSRAGHQSPGSRSSRANRSASSSTTTAPRPGSKRHSSSKPAPPRATSPPSATTASSTSPTTKSHPAPATPKPSQQSHASYTPPRSGYRTRPPPNGATDRSPEPGAPYRIVSAFG